MSLLKSNNNFIKKIYLSSLFPNVIAVLGGTINVFFDGILVGQKMGDIGLSAVSQSLPIYLILCTVGSLFASGASFISSIAIGDNDKEKALRIFRATFIVAIIASVVVCGAGLIFIDNIAKILSTPETFEMVKIYVSITLIGGVFKVLLYVPFFYLRLEGKNNRSASAMLTMTILNIVLDYLFMFVFDDIFGTGKYAIRGAAWASVIATTVACMMSLVYLFTDHSNFTLGFASYKKEEWPLVLKYGSPMALNNVLSSLRILFLNLILKSMNISSLIAIFAVINNLNEFSICIQNGVPQTASAMTGIFFGEKDSSSVKDLFKIEVKTGIVLSFVFSLVITIFSKQIGLLFGSSSDCSIGVICFAISLLFATTNNVLSYYYNAIGRIELANVITICRGFVMVVLFGYIFSIFGEYIWIFYPVAEIMTLLLVVFIGTIIAKKKDLCKFYLIDESFEKSGKSISFTVPCENDKICEASQSVSDFCETNGFDSRKTMSISLAIEEMLMIISQKSLMGHGTIDVRLIKSGEDAILRIRSGGNRYNPIEEMSDDLDYMGVQMISKMAKKTEYLSSLGVNTLIVFL